MVPFKNKVYFLFLNLNRLITYKITCLHWELRIFACNDIRSLIEYAMMLGKGNQSKLKMYLFICLSYKVLHWITIHFSYNYKHNLITTSQFVQTQNSLLRSWHTNTQMTPLPYFNIYSTWPQAFLQCLRVLKPTPTSGETLKN